MAEQGEKMTKVELRAFLDLMMVSDPWPLEEPAHEIMIVLADRESEKHGFENWIVAYHELPSFAQDREDAPNKNEEPPEKFGHTWHECDKPCEDVSCVYCVGGLGYCTVCKCGEGQLLLECPGSALTPAEADAVMNGGLKTVEDLNELRAAPSTQGAHEGEG